MDDRDWLDLQNKLMYPNTLMVSLDAEMLANLIFTYSLDWRITLDFIDSVAKARKMFFDSKKVEDKIKQLIGEIDNEHS
jgi:hypothetical protein